MLLRKKAQSTAEYAITIGLVIAVAAGIMQVALKGGMRRKSQEATGFLSRQSVVPVSSDPGGASEGTYDESLFGRAASTPLSTAGNIAIYDQSIRSTNVAAEGYKDKSILYKGGAEKKIQAQTTTTTSVDVETLDAVNE